MTNRNIFQYKPQGITNIFAPYVLLGNQHSHSIDASNSDQLNNLANIPKVNSQKKKMERENKLNEGIGDYIQQNFNSLMMEGMDYNYEDLENNPINNNARGLNTAPFTPTKLDCNLNPSQKGCGGSNTGTGGSNTGTGGSFGSASGDTNWRSDMVEKSLGLKKSTYNCNTFCKKGMYYSPQCEKWKCPDYGGQGVIKQNEKAFRVGELLSITPAGENIYKEKITFDEAYKKKTPECNLDDRSFMCKSKSKSPIFKCTNIKGIQVCENKDTIKCIPSQKYIKNGKESKPFKITNNDIKHIKQETTGSRDKDSESIFTYEYKNKEKKNVTKNSINLDKDIFKEDKFLNFPIGGCSNELDKIYTIDDWHREHKPF